MKAQVVAASVLGSLAVYTAMVACTKSGEIFGTGGAGGAGGSASGNGGVIGQGGVGGATNSGGAGAGMPNAAADPVSGSRLKAKYRQSEDGAKAYLPYIWYDSERKEDCGFALAADGKERCLPLGTHNAAAGSYFANPACTDPLAHSVFPDCIMKYASGSVKTSDACQLTGYGMQFFTLGAKVNPATVYYKSGAECVATSITTFVFYAVGPEIPPSAFVAGTVMTDP